MSHADQTVRQLYANRRENPILRWMTRGRGVQWGHLLFTLMMLGGIVSSLAVANSMTNQDEAEAVGFAAIAVYSLFVPFLLAAAIPLSIKRPSPLQKQEIWITLLSPREIAFGVLYTPLRMTAIIVALYPLLLAIWLLFMYWQDMPMMIRGVSEPGRHIPSIILPVAFMVALYLYYCAAAAYIPLLSRVRSFRIPWSPVLIAPLWALGQVGATVGVMIIGEAGYREMLYHIMGPGQERHDVSSVISVALMVSIIAAVLYVAARSLTARAGVKWLEEAVPHVAAGVDWFSADRRYDEWSNSEKQAAWRDFLHRARQWWRWRLKWAALGWALAVAPMTIGFLAFPWGLEFRSLEWSGLAATPLMVPAMLFLPSMLWKDADAVPFMPRRLLLSSLILFAPCTVLCGASAILGLMLQEGFTLFNLAMIAYAVFMLIVMMLYLGLPCYVAWLWLARGGGRARRLAIVGILYIAFVPAAAGLWNWATLPGVVILGGVVAFLACGSLMGSISILLQRCFLDQAPGQK